MTQVIETTVYTYDELSPKAQEKAREWYCERGFDYDWYNFTQESFELFLEAIGFNNVSSQFSGFWSQGDGASFDFKGIEFDDLFNAETETGFPQLHTTLELWRAANATLIKQCKRFKRRLSGSSATNGYATHYCHQNTRYASLELDTGGTSGIVNRCEKLTTALEKAVTHLMRSLSIDYYKALESEYEYLTSAESVADSIRANEYIFTENGKRF